MDLNGRPNLKPERKKLKLTPFQKIVEKHIFESYRENVHTSMYMKVLMDKLFLLKKTLEGKNPNKKYPFYAFLIKSVADAIIKYPIFNSHYIQGEVFLNEQINVGFAVDFNGALLVPNVKNCQSTNLDDISSQVIEKTQLAREGKLKPVDLQNGTFTVNNLGPYGVEYFSAIVNSPEIAILTSGAVFNQPVCVVNKQEIIVKPVMTIGLTFNHRVLNGSLAAQFLNSIKSWLEKPPVNNEYY